MKRIYNKGLLSSLLKNRQTKRKLKVVIRPGTGDYTANTASKQKQYPKLIHEINLLTYKHEESKQLF